MVVLWLNVTLISRDPTMLPIPDMYMIGPLTLLHPSSTSTSGSEVCLELGLSCNIETLVRREITLSQRKCMHVVLLYVLSTLFQSWHYHCFRINIIVFVKITVKVQCIFYHRCTTPSTHPPDHLQVPSRHNRAKINIWCPKPSQEHPPPPNSSLSISTDF